MTVDAYVRGWDDCLEAVAKILAGSKDLDAAKGKIDRLGQAIKDDKFEKIKYELKAFDLF
ncbi:MAG: hypothetical protein ACQCN6_01510 [Candidatus Bathyarchaeia archaeon]|jgi:hypothetical protein